VRSLSAGELLTVWEHGLASSGIRRAVMLLAAAFPEHSVDQIVSFSIGTRNICLLQLRESLFGPRLASLVTCPQCGERLELELQHSDFGIDAAPVETLVGHEPFCCRIDGYEIRFRLPDSRDLLEITDQAIADVEAARRQLLERCLLSISRRGESLRPEDLGPERSHAVAAAMEQADATANLQVEMACPVCRHGWQAPFDVITFLWTEIDAWAKRLLREVHVLARAYGWRETDILGFSSLRRQAYLELLGT